LPQNQLNTWLRQTFTLRYGSLSLDTTAHTQRGDTLRNFILWQALLAGLRYLHNLKRNPPTCDRRYRPVRGRL